MKALRLHAIGDLRCDEVPVPKPGPGELLLRVGACGVCGSDIPRSFLLGTRINPVTLGHEFAGEVVAVGSPADEDLLGKRAAVFNVVPCHRCGPCAAGDYAHCESISYLGTRIDGGFAEYCLVPGRFHLVLCEDESVSDAELAMLEPMAVALHTVRKTEIHGWETMLVVGAGPIGILIARWAALFGVNDILLADVRAEKIAFANARGVRCVHVDEVPDTLDAMTRGRGAQVVVEGTGSSAGLGLAIDRAAASGRVVLLGNPRDELRIPTERYSTLLRKELTLKSVWNSFFGEDPVNEWRYGARCLERGQLAVADLITHRAGLEELPALFRNIHTGDAVACKAMYAAR